MVLSIVNSRVSETAKTGRSAWPYPRVVFGAFEATFLQTEVCLEISPMKEDIVSMETNIKMTLGPASVGTPSHPILFLA